MTEPVNKGVPHICREVRDFPETPPPTGPMIEFLNENGCCTSKTAQWPELMRKLDDCMLWHKAGGIFSQLDRPFPFDPQDIPDETSTQLASLKEYYGGGNIPCEDVAYITENPLEQEMLCVGQHGEVGLPFELTSCESLQRCIAGQDPGTCSEIAYKKASEMLYLNPTCPILVAVWPKHIEVESPYGANANFNAQIQDMGPPLYVTDRPSELLATYYLSLSLKASSDAKALEIARSAASLMPDEPYVLYALAYALIDIGLFISAEGAAARLKEVGALYYYYDIFQRLRLHDGDIVKMREMRDSMAYMDPWNARNYQDKAYDLLHNFTSLEQLRRASQLNMEAYFLVLEEDEAKEISDEFEESMTWEIFLWQSKTGRYMLACLYLVTGDIAKAEEIARPQAMESDEYFDLMFNILKEKGMMNDALELAKGYLARHPSSLPAKHALAETYFELGRNDEARALYLELTRSDDPKYRSIGYSRLGYLNDPYDPSDLELAQKALNEDPANAKNYFDLAMEIIMETGDDKKALQLMEDGRRLDPFNEVAYAHLGAIYLWSCQPEKAMMWLRLYTTLTGDYTANDYMGHALLSMGENAAAVDAFDSALSSSIDTNTLAGMVTALYELNDPRYKFYLKELLTLKDTTGRSRLFFMLGRMAEKDGDSKSAVKYYQLAVSRMPGFGEAKKRLIALGGTPQSAEFTYLDELAAFDEIKRRSE